MSTTAPSPRTLRFGAFEIHLRARELRKSGQRIRLQDQPFQILAMLLEHPGEVVTREELREKLWPADTFVDFDHSLNTAINKIREALGDSSENPRFVETLPRRGYRFIARVEATPTSTPAEPQLQPELRPPAVFPIPKVRLVTGSIGVALLIAMGSALWLATRGNGIDSVAVLPFTSVSGDTNTGNICDGIAESLIHNLSQVPQLRVTSFASTDRFRGRQTDPQAAGRELGVRAILTGKVIPRPEGLDVRMELVDVTDRSHIWGGQYEGKLADILMMQGEVSREISENLRRRLSGEEKDRLEAHQLYLKGRSYWNKRTVDGLDRGIGFFQQAVARDPKYALAHAALADSYNMLGRYGALPPKEAYPQARTAAERALELDDTLAEAHTALAFVRHRFEWDWRGAQVEFRRAIELRPSYAPAHQWYASYLVAMGSIPEAIAEAEQTRKLDPLSLVARSHLGWVRYLSRDYPQAIQECKATLELDPNFFVARRYLGLAYEQGGRHEEAITELEKAVALSGGTPLTKAELAHAYGKAGRKAEARKILDELTASPGPRYVSPYCLATAYAGLEDQGQALNWLVKAFDDRSDELVYLNVEPRFDPLRSHPRFRDLLRRMNFPP